MIVINGETGAIAHRFADVLDVHESPAWAWSPDSRWLVLRTHGEVLPGRYVRHQARVRLYACPASRRRRSTGTAGRNAWRNRMPRTRLAASGDGRLLVTQAGSELRVYRIRRTAGP